jgi:hypothetical protein
MKIAGRIIVLVLVISLTAILAGGCTTTRPPQKILISPIQ